MGAKFDNLFLGNGVRKVKEQDFVRLDNPLIIEMLSHMLCGVFKRMFLLNLFLSENNPCQVMCLILIDLIVRNAMYIGSRYYQLFKI